MLHQLIMINIISQVQVLNITSKLLAQYYRKSTQIHEQCKDKHGDQVCHKKSESTQFNRNQSQANISPGSADLRQLQKYLTSFSTTNKNAVLFRLTKFVTNNINTTYYVMTTDNALM